MVFIYFIGHLQATAREYWLQENGAGWMARGFLALVALIFPDLQAFNLVDEIVAGAVIRSRCLQKRPCSESFTLRSTRFWLRSSFTAKNYDDALLGGAGSGSDLRVTKLPAERALFVQHRQLHFRGGELNLDLREQIGQLGFIAALSGFRSMVADALFIQAHVAWERTEWGRVFLLFRQVTTLQPPRCLVLGHGRLAHGLERERCRDE